jgi:hypothetical protein
MPFVLKLLLPALLTTICASAAAQSDWDVLQTTTFRPAVDSYVPPYPIRHPASLATCHSIIEQHQAEKDRLGREHQQCLDGFHAPARKSGLRKEDCSIHVCQVLHTQQLYANSEVDDQVAKRYESDCIASFKQDHPSRPQSTATYKPDYSSTHTQGSFLDDPAPTSASGSEQKNSVAEQLARQHQKNLDSLKPAPAYTASYTPSTTGPYAQKPSQPKGDWGFCNAIVGDSTYYLSQPFQFKHSQEDALTKRFKDYLLSSYGSDYPEGTAYAPGSRYILVQAMTFCLTGDASSAEVQAGRASDPSLNDPRARVIHVPWP